MVCLYSSVVSVRAALFSICCETTPPLVGRRSMKPGEVGLLWDILIISKSIVEFAGSSCTGLPIPFLPSALPHHDLAILGYFCKSSHAHAILFILFLFPLDHFSLTAVLFLSLFPQTVGELDPSVSGRSFGVNARGFACSPPSRLLDMCTRIPTTRSFPVYRVLQLNGNLQRDPSPLQLVPRWDTLTLCPTRTSFLPRNTTSWPRIQ